MVLLRHSILVLIAAVALGSAGCTRLRSIYNVKSAPAAPTVPQAFAAASLLNWVQTSPSATSPVTATWTKSTEPTLANQKIQFYSDASCLTTQGLLIDLASTATQIRSFTPPGDGTYTYKITSIDALAQTSVSSCSSPMVIDSTAPVNPTALTWVQSSPYNSNSVTASWTKSISTDLSSQKIQFYSDASCTATSGSLTSVSPATGQTAAVTLPGDGSYTYKITSTDTAGNSSTSGCSGVMVIDSVAPANATALAWTETSPYNSTAVHASWTKSAASDLASQKIQYYADASCTTASGSLVSLTAAAQTNAFTAPAEGSYTYKVTSIDTAGNSSTSGCSGVMVIDTTAPTNASALSWTETSPHSGTSVNASWTKSVSTDLASQKIQYYADATCTSTQGSLTPLTAAAQTNAFTAPGDGSYTYKITSVDNAGNSATSACSATMVIDSTAPAAATSLSWTETSPHVGTSVNASWTKSVATDLSVQKIQFYADGTCSTTSGSLTTISPATAQTYAWTAPGSGTFSYKLTSLDAAGNSTASGCSSAMVIGSPTLSWTVSSFDFSNRVPTEKTETIFMVLSNSGTASATGCSAPTLTNTTDFEISIDNCGTNDLAQSDYCYVGVRAKVQTVATRTATISRVCTVGGTAAGTPNGITVTGQAAIGNGYISEADHWWNTSSIGINSSTYDLYFANSGTATITGCSAPTLDNTTDFTLVSDGCGTSDLLRDQACKMTLRVNSTTTGPKNATLDRSCGAGSTYMHTYSNGLGVVSSTQSNPVFINGSDGWTCAVLANGTVRCWGDPGNSGVGDGNAGQAAVYPSEVVGVTGATQVAVGRRAACAIVTSGAVKCWGDNTSGQIGDGTNTDRPIAVSVPGLSTGVLSVSMGESHACAALSNHTVKCWGAGSDGQLGNGANADSNTPVVVSGISNANAVTAQGSSSCALLSTGAVKCWGNNQGGQLGNGTWGNSTNTPTTVSGISTANQISRGQDFTCVVLADTTVQCWGGGGGGMLGDGNNGNSNIPVVVSGLTGVTKMSGGYNHMCAILTDQSVKCWGNNGRSIFGDLYADNVTTPMVMPNLTNVTAISGNSTSICVIQTDNSVRCSSTNLAGDGFYGMYPVSREPMPVLDITNAVQIKSGYDSSCALLSDNTMKCWGANQGNLGNGFDHPNSRPVVPVGISGVSDFGIWAATCAVMSGNIKCWGYARDGQVGNGSYNNFEYLPVSVTGITNAVQVRPGDYQTCALLSTGAVKCWGYNGEGELGDGTNTQSAIPVDVVGITNAIEIASGGSHTCARFIDGTMKCWGNNDQGQLGDGTTTNRNVPTAVVGLKNVTGLTLGNSHTCALLSDSSVRCWGRNDENQLGNASVSGTTGIPQPVYNLANAQKVVAFENSTCIRDTNSIQRCWGQGSGSQMGDRTRNYPDRPLTIMNLGTTVDISMGSSHACAIIPGGSIKCWGAPGSAGATGYISNDNAYLRKVSGI